MCQWNKWNNHVYSDGATVCAPNPKVMKSISKEIRAVRATSAHEVRVAAAMGLVPADVSRSVGMNDGVFYPPEEGPPPNPAGPSPLDMLAMVTAKSVSAPRTLHALALMVDFSDNVGVRPSSDFDTLLFDANNPNSMTSYYNTISGGRLQVTGQAVGYVRMPQKYTYYTNGKSGMDQFGYPQNGPGLLFDALTEFCKNNSLQPFDTDGDGYVDGIFLIHAGGGAEAEPNPTKRKDMIWSHKWVLPTKFTHQGVSVYAYSTEPEDGRVGVFAHEFGHVLGLPDLYDTTYRSGGIGEWCLMAGGSWCGGGNQPCRMSAWCLDQLGWLKPKNVSAAKTLKVKAVTDSYRLWTKGKASKEYFLMENRQQTGQDAALPGAGLALWHIDERQSGNTNPLSYLVGLVQADGNKDLELNANSGDDADLFPGSGKVRTVGDTTTDAPSTRSNSGNKTGVKLSSIKDTAGVISVKVKV